MPLDTEASPELLQRRIAFFALVSAVIVAGFQVLGRVANLVADDVIDRTLGPKYLDGLDLQRLVEADGPQAPACVIRILEQVAGALSEAHARGLIHRDVKPANVILCERGGQLGVANVVDFGLVKRLDPATDSSTSTASMGIIGTPLYLSPESILKPDSIDARSDLCSRGAVGFFLLTVRRPSTATPSWKSAATTCIRHRCYPRSALPRRFRTSSTN